MVFHLKIIIIFYFLISIITSLTHSLVQFSRSAVSDSLWPHESQHARPPCPSPTPGVHPNPCPLCQWCHPTISSSVVPFSSCPQSFPRSLAINCLIFNYVGEFLVSYIFVIHSTWSKHWYVFSPLKSVISFMIQDIRQFW